jgi:hypothetical protein
MLAADTAAEVARGPLFTALHQIKWLAGPVEIVETALGFDRPTPGLTEILFALFLSFGLTWLIASVYRATFRGPKFSQDYVHTLMILGTVVTVVVMVVRNGNDVEKSQATAFGMFAAFSIIRFRTSLAEARDIGFIFLAMASGLAVGARQYALASATTIVILAIITMFSRGNWFAPSRASHFLRIRVTNDIDYDTAFSEIFERCLDQFDLLSVETIQAGMMTELRYSVCMKEGCKPSDLVTGVQIANGNNRVLLTSTAGTRTLGTD